MTDGLSIVPVDFDEACAFVARHHRHHLPPQGHKFSIAIADSQGTIRGVAMVGRPTARRLDDGWTLEVKRVATDGTRNACSALYGGARRAAFALGFRKLVTFNLETESGASLRGAGFRVVASTPGKTWSVPSRPRVDKHPLQGRLRWETTA